MRGSVSAALCLTGLCGAGCVPGLRVVDCVVWAVGLGAEQ